MKANRLSRTALMIVVLSILAWSCGNSDGASSAGGAAGTGGGAAGTGGGAAGTGGGAAGAGGGAAGTGGGAAGTGGGAAGTAGSSGGAQAGAAGQVDVDAGSPDSSGGNDANQDSQNDGDIGTYLGTMWNTYYLVSFESNYSGPKDSTLYGPDCKPLAVVPSEFFQDLCVEGSGKLSNGQVLGYAGDCSCATACAWDGGKKCWVALDNQYPWGMGSTGNAIVPMRSWAVDNSLIAAGTTVYAKQWDGVQIPSHDGLGGFEHDGCFRADDTGGAVGGNHYDFFAGTHAMWQALEGIFPTGTNFDVYVNPGRCSYLAK